MTQVETLTHKRRRVQRGDRAAKGMSVVPMQYLTKNLMAMRARSVPLAEHASRHLTAAAFTSEDAGCQDGGS